ncbi:MAG TPA: hypothetical protein PKI62_03455 [bacterium]|nr:hypothetical protein [bacterium]HPR88352.1 hypothetical protein [bacterium]
MNAEEQYLSGIPRYSRVAVCIAVIALALSAVGALQNPTQFYHSWLVAVVFGLTIALGALFLNMVFHLTGAQWSLPVRRLLEHLAAILPLLFVLFLPLLGGLHELYEWSHAERMAHDPVVQLKSPFLNAPFFILRALMYLAIWTLLAWRLRHLSLKEDATPTPELASRMRKLSAAGTILFALTVTFAAFDWLMSLDARWYSTIFGVYVFSGCVVAGLAAVILLLHFLHSQGHLRTTAGLEVYHDLGRLLLTFMIFWAYMAASQYFLIWYGNIPEETIWYQHRWHGGWRAVSLLLVFGHFAIPFPILLTRWAKRNVRVLSLCAAWLLLMHWVDLNWLVMPTLHAEGFALSWQDLAALLGILASSLGYLGWLLQRHALAPRAAAAPPETPGA